MEHETSELVSIFPNLSKQVISDALSLAKTIASSDPRNNDALSVAINILLGGNIPQENNATTNVPNSPNNSRTTTIDLTKEINNSTIIPLERIPSQFENITEEEFERFKKDFYDEKKSVSPIYKEVALYKLNTQFSKIQKPFISQLFASHNFRFLPTRKALENLPAKDSKRVTLKKARIAKVAEPSEKCEELEKEIEFGNFEPKFQQQIQDAKVAKKTVQSAYEDAEKKGELLECGCCFNEYILEDMAQCADGHLFCLECCRRAANEEIGKGKVHFKCMNSNPICTYEFPDSELKRILPKTIYEKHLERKQKEEIQSAKIDNLESCPFCDFMVIMNTKKEEDRIFNCQNPTCMKQSCRLCKEPSHIPLRCNEVEKKPEVEMRKFLETRMSEALVRKCWKCSKVFFKTEGCNHMKCLCGAFTCYYCGKKVDSGYSHFGDGKCPQNIDSVKFNEENVKKAYDEAYNEWISKHPEMKGIDLKYDPMSVLKPVSKKRKRKGQ